MADSSSLRIALFCHSIVSDWNHGNAHFLRGLIRALQSLGHSVIALEEEDNWSLHNLLQHQGEEPLLEFRRHFPFIRHQPYLLNGRAHLRSWLTDLLSGVDVCLVHEWNPADLVRAIGETAARLGVVSLFHDTHHRALTEPHRIPSLGLQSYSAILAYGPAIAELYRSVVDGPEVLVFHEAADTDLFRPLPRPKSQDVVFVGNWGDEDRNCSTREFFIEQARTIRELRFALYGVRYPPEVIEELRRTGIHWRGWLPNHRAPEAYAASRLTIHIPRKEYLESLPGTPTIRVFEALACGVPLVSAGWKDSGGLFHEGTDFLAVETPSQMREALRWLASDPEARERIGSHGLETVLARHTCRHRALELIDIVRRRRAHHG